MTHKSKEKSDDPRMAQGLNQYIDKRRQELIADGLGGGELTRELEGEVSYWVSYGLRKVPGIIHPVSARRRKAALRSEALKNARGEKPELTENDEIMYVAAQFTGVLTLEEIKSLQREATSLKYRSSRTNG